MIINSHTLIHAEDAGNGYHGNCQHCGVPLVTNLGYCSWDKLKCIDREVENWNDIPNEIKSYANFRSLKWNRKKKVFIKSYSYDKYTIDQLNEIINKIKFKCAN